jgi:serine/threonine protein kinase
MMREVLDALYENKVQGPQLFRLDSEFGLELGSGLQFTVTAASDEYTAKLKYAIDSWPDNFLKPAMSNLLSSVVKRAHWQPEAAPHRRHHKQGPQDVSIRDSKKELHIQLRSAKVEIEKLCNRAYQKHPNIVKLRGWGLSLDTYEGLKPFDTRIPLLILERANCDLGQFMATPEYSSTPYSSLMKICADIGNGLGGLHQGNITHGDMKPENILLFFDNGPSGFTWKAKLCDFGNAESKPATLATDSLNDAGKACQQHFEYCGTAGWAPPENLRKLDFEGLKRCDIYVYGLIVWRVFENKKGKGSRRGILVGPIDEDNLAPYRDEDKAYRCAAKTIRESTIIIAEKSKVEIRRILAVLRGALQPEPTHRDPRPWRYLNTIRFPAVRNLEELPGPKPKDAFTSLINSYIIPFSTQQAARVRENTEDFLGYFLHSTSLRKTRVKRWVSSFKRKAGRQARLEKLFAQAFVHVELVWDGDNVEIIPHTGLSCHDLTTFLERFTECCKRNANPWSPGDIINSYARLRSIFPLCCWQNALHQSQLHSFNVLEISLRAPSRDDYAEWQNIASMRGYSLSTIAWLLRGEIGEWELESIQNVDESSNLLWQWTIHPHLQVEVSSQLFQLFVEKGGYVGGLLKDNDGSTRTILRHYLELLAEESVDTRRNSELIRQSCATVLRGAARILAKKSDSKPVTNIAKLRFFFSGEGPDHLSLNDHDEVKFDAADVVATTVLHEAVLSCCFTAVDYFVNYSVVPLTVRNQNSETALDLAYSLRASRLKHWQHVHNGLIISALSQNALQHERLSGLPLGWDEVNFESGFSAYHESTISPQNPSVTFEIPKFSLLQHRTISLGSPTHLGRGPVYGFDLVRFIQKTKNEVLYTDIYNDDWYQKDIQEAHPIFENVSAVGLTTGQMDHRLLAEDILRESGTKRLQAVPRILRVPLLRFYLVIKSSVLVLKTVLFKNYLSILLVLLPLSFVGQANGWLPLINLFLSFLGLLPLISMQEFCLHEWTSNTASNLEQNLLSYVAGCFLELCVSLHSYTLIIETLVLTSF